MLGDIKLNGRRHQVTDVHAFGKAMADVRGGKVDLPAFQLCGSDRRLEEASRPFPGTPAESGMVKVNGNIPFPKGVNVIGFGQLTNEISSVLFMGASGRTLFYPPIAVKDDSH